MDMSHRFVAGWEGARRDNFRLGLTDLFLDNGHWSHPSLLPPVVGSCQVLISVLFAIIVRMDK